MTLDVDLSWIKTSEGISINMIYQSSRDLSMTKTDNDLPETHIEHWAVWRSPWRRGESWPSWCSPPGRSPSSRGPPPSVWPPARTSSHSGLEQSETEERVSQGQSGLGEDLLGGVLESPALRPPGEPGRGAGPRGEAGEEVLSATGERIPRTEYLHCQGSN